MPGPVTSQPLTFDEDYNTKHGFFLVEQTTIPILKQYIFFIRVISQLLH